MVNFNKDIDPASADAGTTFQISPAVTGVLSVSGSAITFNPDGNLAAGTLYTVTITTGLLSTDAEPLTLKSDHVFTFTTGSGTDSTAPTVSLTIPEDFATDVAVNTTIQITFSEPINALDTDVAIDPVVAFSNFSVAGNTITITLADNLEYATVYMVTVGTGVTDLASNALASPYQFAFITGDGPDVIGPSPIITIPSDGETEVSPNPTIIIAFDEPIRASSITSSTVRLLQGATPIPCTRDTSAAATMGMIALSPNSPLSLNTEYTVELTTGITDISNNPMASNVTFSFTTEATVDTDPPILLSTNPSDGSNLDPSELYYPDPMDGYFIIIGFNDDIDGDSISGITLVGAHQGPVSISRFAMNDSVIIRLSGAPENDDYTVTLPDTIEDDSGNNYAGSTFTFRVDDGTGDFTAPTVTSSDPENNDTGVSRNTAVIIMFSEGIEASSVTSSTFVLRRGATPISCARDTSMAPMGMIVITPNSPLNLNTVHTVTVTTGITDLAGNHLESDVTISFTTEATVDETPPALTGTMPTDGATIYASDLYYDSPGGYFILIIFDDDIDGDSVSGITMVGDTEGAISIMPGAFAEMVVISLPGAPASDTYTVTLPNSITDDSGNHYAGSTFSFTVAE